MVYQLNDVSVRYKDQTALEHINCTIEIGKWISVIGQTGAGKSTFVKVLKGLIPTIEGEYLIHHQPASRDRRGKLQVVPEIGFVFQYPEHQLYETTVERELSFAMRLQGAPQAEIQDFIQVVLPQVGLSEEVLLLSPFQLSGGQKRKVALAAVLMSNPQVLIVDEPTAGLDPVSRTAMLQLLKGWQQQGERTVIFVSHQMEDVAEYSDEVLVLHEGRLMGHFETAILFLERTELFDELGLLLPEPIQLLKFVEELSGHRIGLNSCREADIFARLAPILAGKEHLYG